jgi:hypothetical protein
LWIYTPLAIPGEGEEDGARTDKENLSTQDYYNAFLDVLSSVRGGEIRDMPVSSALGFLEEEARAVDVGEDDNALTSGVDNFIRRYKIFKIHLSGGWASSAGRKSMRYGNSRKRDASARANIQGNVSATYSDGPDGGSDVPRRSA